VPFNTYPVCTESGNNVVGATFYGSSDYAGKDLHVKLLDLTSVSDQMDFADISTIKNSMKTLTLEEIKDSEVKDVLFTADIDGDIPSIQSGFVELNGMTQGYYALVVMDDSNPNMPCIVAEAPIIVTKNAMDVSTIDSAPKPGDSITFIENQDGALPGTYTYIVAMVPEANYTADINITSDGTISGTFVTFHGLSLNETFNVVSDGMEEGTTVYFDGLAADHVALSKSDLDNADYMKQLAKDELAESNIAIGVKTTTETTRVQVNVPTTDTMLTGKYIVLAAAVDRDTGRIAAINQTTISLGATWEYHLYAGWNLISIPLKPEHTDVSEFFPAEAMNAITVVWQYNSSNPPSGWWSYYTPKTDLYDPGTLTTISEKYGYWVLCDYEVTFQVTGTIPSDTLVPINSNNWNLVGNPTIEERPVADVYTDIDVIWQFDGSQTPDKWWSYYTPKTDLYDQGTLTAINPGFGYWILK
jgi:methanogen extracellular protein (TIGR04279 family)